MPRCAILLNRKANRCIRSKSPHKIRILWITILLRTPLVGFITLRVCSSIAFSFFCSSSSKAAKMAFTRFVDFADISRLSISRSLLVFCLQLKANCQEYWQYFFALHQKKPERIQSSFAILYKYMFFKKYEMYLPLSYELIRCFCC